MNDWMSTMTDEPRGVVCVCEWRRWTERSAMCVRALCALCVGA